MEEEPIVTGTPPRIQEEKRKINEWLSRNRKERRRLGIRGARGMQIPYNKRVETWEQYQKRTAPAEPPAFSEQVAELMDKDAKEITKM